ncbi:hypothetical protein HSACCH_01054 [Halanaerobium saccharolyticum subsp. saccharolyticum DSM 6643]|uniref:Uncharacterized protein n=1 Tax=Halanaerobium saccharolyticum subsp. saccharolyticum DSM 6643 TaxID=1293054 RepID=M5E046_9FIRM|nr:hypothetical protein [Halanaerobium saccharolyticum]CCU79048.1 hypothetical protein HSACCH_01054 [Halanaerobium saccharolyticum subsp. saccharolyticum DSM 6643]
MEIDNFDMDNKPNEWPANAIECQLDNIYTQLTSFKEESCYKNKEVLLSLISDYDLNQSSMLGLVRTTDYEVALINTLFFEAMFLNLSALKTYLYELVGHKTRMQKMASLVSEGDISLEIEEFKGLFHSLKLYHITYQQFNVEKNGSYTENLVEVVEEFIEFSKENDPENIFEKNIEMITKSYISLLNDISYFRCIKRNKIWAFSRNEIYKLFNLAAKLSKLNGDSPVVSPLKGVLMTSISNYILKSRNDYNKDYICKYISSEVAKKSIDNHEIWMSKIENLNDEREQRVVPELFEEAEWINHSWANNINFESKREYYVSSFSKTLNDSIMKKEYGACIYGYKDDRMVEVLSPIMYRYKKDDTKSPAFSQVIAFDVIYDREEAKKEIKFLCDVIDCFDISDVDKNSFLEEILQYWILSVKDKKWAYERERRYVLFMYDDYDYKEIDTKNPSFLKLKTSLFIQPDFILGENPVKPFIRKMVENKRKAIYTKPYLFCNNCLNRDFDIVAGGIKEINSCTVCGSQNISLKKPSK